MKMQPEKRRTKVQYDTKYIIQNESTIRHKYIIQNESTIRHKIYHTVVAYYVLVLNVLDVSVKIVCSLTNRFYLLLLNQAIVLCILVIVCLYT
jgi:hypothetical protein